MANLQEVPVVDVQSDNIQELWPTLLLAVRSSAFIAIDTELSGLGNRKQLNAKILDDRYTALGNIARTRSILSVGLSCFKYDHHEATSGNTDSDVAPKIQKRGLKFVCQTFNILMLCSEEYVVEPLSLRFLVNHNFDFNRQYSKGIPYYRGPDQEKAGDRQWMRELLEEITSNEIPIVFHNAFVDLGFLYQSFHTNLPSSIGSFLADLTEVFPGGVFDTKYIAEFQARYPASYLEYVFRKSQRDNQEAFKENRQFMSISTLKYPTKCSYITCLPCNVPAPTTEVTELCITYAGHGWCAQGIKCPKSHDINVILDADENYRGKRKRRKRKAKEEKQQSQEAADITKDEQITDDPEMDTETQDDESNMEKDNVQLDDCDMVNDDSTVCQTSGSLEQNNHSAFKKDSQVEESLPLCSEMENIEVSETTTEIGDTIEQEKEAVQKVQDTGRQDKPSNENRSRTEGHRACFDAFMTGFIFAHFIQRYGKRGQDLTEDSGLGMAEFANKVTLSGKDIPLKIVRSNFIKTSKEHRLKMNKT